VRTIAEVAVFVLILGGIAFVRLKMAGAGGHGKSGGCGCGGHGGACGETARAEPEDAA